MARRPHVDHLGGGIYELRVAMEQHQHRLLYFSCGRSVIVVTSGLLKNVGKVPQQDIAPARERRADWRERFGGDA
jgi:phage-related protein